MTAPLLVAGRPELEQLRLQARVWNPLGEALLAPYARELRGARTLDAGCGALGWLPVLSRAVGPGGSVVGSDVDPDLLAAARAAVDDEALANVTLVEDDLLASGLPGGFDLVHARFRLAPLGRVGEQLDACRRLLRDGGGLLVLEEPDPASWHFEPAAAAAGRLVELVLAAFALGGGDFAVGRRLPGLVRERFGVQPEVHAHALELHHGHPYLRLPLRLSTLLRPHLLELVGEAELDRLEAETALELAEPRRAGTTFTLVQTVARL